MKNSGLKKTLVSLVLLTFFSIRSFAWGPEGHTMVVEIAMHFLKDDVKKNIQSYLGDMTLAEAANWMDSVRSNSDYDFQKPWHYIDFAKGKTYAPSTDENIVNRLIITFNELRHKNVLCNDQVKRDLLILLHLMGDLHQPLHTGYDDDLGGNRVQIQYEFTKTNLHHFWDEDIIDSGKVSTQSCLQLYQSLNPATFDTIQGIHFASWMEQTRLLLDSVYSFPGFILNENYFKWSKLVVEKQLLLAGVRLAAILDKLFYTPAPIINTAALTSQYPNGIDAADAVNNVGKTVTVCSRVFGLRTSDKVSMLNLGAKYPNSTLTVVIFAKDRMNFKGNVEELFSDKNICVTGKVQLFNGKAEIVISKPEDIELK